MMQLTQNRVATGRILGLGVFVAALMAVLMLAAQPSHASTTFTVNSTEDHSDANLGISACDTGYDLTGAGGGQVDECTLRAAIEQANYTSGADTINFAIPGSGVKTIAPDSDMPNLTDPVTINGYSQPGALPNTKAVGSDAVLKIELSGANVSDGDGLAIEAANSTVKGLVINRWRNAGIFIFGSGATGNKVSGNYVGTDASGTQDLGNFNGVYIYEAPNNAIGGATAAERNVISGNSLDGVMIHNAAATGNRVTGNYVGTDKNGVADLGNSEQGVGLSNAPKNTVGGTTAGERNVISGNDGNGVQISGSGATGNKVSGNYVGTDRNGAVDLGNSFRGVDLEDASNNTIGGATTAARNVISGNDDDGVEIDGDGATGNRVLQNSIYANGGLGIDLAGTITNDPGDADTGANDLQNYPVLSSSRTSATSTTVRGTLNSTPNKTIVVRLFSNPSGTDEGKTFIGQKSVTTDASGNVSFTFSPAQKVGLGQTVTATATSQAGNTSEFSAPRTVVAP